ncbi:auxin-responsive protein SAUR36-like [Impatiens glandulifera]|uniref:auxin-responsive protein SAUR36-like n=1 Tax=Impatiens glandulifera TaxID=253017 RepID=UPI001FB13879|nr:auxin-responsive protein SAUR36-like [Impatiens glandulifera]
MKKKIHGGGGLKLKRRIKTLFFFRTLWPRYGYHRVNPPENRNGQIISRAFHCLKKKAKALCFRNPCRSYASLSVSHSLVPKGKMAVYVGRKGIGAGDEEEEEEIHRFLIPLIYINHPLFVQLLREAEEEFGFEHPGGLTIPCRVSEFEKVKRRIEAGAGAGDGDGTSDSFSSWV